MVPMPSGARAHTLVRTVSLVPTRVCHSTVRLYKSILSLETKTLRAVAISVTAFPRYL
jgi:hypothetical protein